MSISPERETRELRLQQIRREAELRAASISKLPSALHADTRPSNGHGAMAIAGTRVRMQSGWQLRNGRSAQFSFAPNLLEPQLASFTFRGNAHLSLLPAKARIAPATKIGKASCRE